MTSELRPAKPLSEGGEVSPSTLLREQRELALACFILSASISMAILWTNLRGEPAAMGEAREAVALHQKLVHQHQVLLADNQKVLADVEAVRDALRRSHSVR